MNNDKRLKSEFIDNTLKKIKVVLDLIFEYYDVQMTYNIDERNKLFCEILKKTKKELTTTEMFSKIQEVVWTIPTATTEPIELKKEESEWLSTQIFEYHRDIFLLHYFYAALYSYNYDIKLREKITQNHIEKFFEKANEIHKKYQNLKQLKKNA